MSSYTLVNGNRLYGGQALHVHDVLTSLSGRFTLAQQMDGRLVVYDRSHHRVHWASAEQGELPLNDRYLTVLTPQGVLITMLNCVVKWVAEPARGAPVAGHLTTLILGDDGTLTLEVDKVGRFPVT